MPPKPVSEEDAWICAPCVGEAFLSAEIERLGETATCTFCEEEGLAYTMEQMADRIEAVVCEHFYRTPTDPDGFEYAMMKEGDQDWEREGEPTAIAIMNLAEIPEKAAEDVQAILGDRNSDLESAQMGEETEFDSEAHYAETRADVRQFEEAWSRFERSIKGEARFFGPSAEAVLFELFHDIHSHVDRRGEAVVVRTIGPDTSITRLHRARVFQSDAKLKEALAAPERLIGTPSSAYAANGRMNARGVPVFYAATADQVALKEVRPPVGSRVVTAEFEVLRPLTVLDLAALRSVSVSGSLFDPSFGRLFNRAEFLKRLSNRIVAPVMPDDEATDYLVTQVMAEYLAYRIDPPLDGILYPSAQNAPDERNVVLFNRAARVRSVPLEPGAKISVDTFEFGEEDAYPSYSVLKELPPEAPEPPRLGRFGRDWVGLRSDDEADRRVDSLELDRATLNVRHIEGIEISETPYMVAQHVWERPVDVPGRPSSELGDDFPF